MRKSEVFTRVRPPKKAADKKIIQFFATKFCLSGFAIGEIWAPGLGRSCGLRGLSVAAVGLAGRKLEDLSESLSVL